MRKQIVKVISSLMLVVFFVGVAPKEYIHDVLFHHHDTVHPVYKPGEIVITGKHIHCAFMGFVFAPFISTDKQFFVFREFAVHTTCYVLPDYYYRYSSLHEAYSLRGPPYCSHIS